MAALRKANAYTKRHTVPFTRVSKKRQKSYIKVVPPQKIVKFDMGNTSLYQKGKFAHILTVMTTEKVQVRNNALEACRQFLNKQFERAFAGNYFFKVVPFPHHIQRENKMLTGAGADRMSTGMQLSFGRSIGKAALVKVDAPLFIFATNDAKGIQIARKEFQKIKAKLPCKTRSEYTFVKQ